MAFPQLNAVQLHSCN